MFDVKINSDEKFEFLKNIFPNAKVNSKGDDFEYFDNLRAEYDSLTSGVALRDISTSGVFEIIGKDALDFLHRISTNSLKDLKPLESKWTLFTNEKGRIIDRSLVVNFNDYVILLGSSEFKNKLYSWLNKYIMLEDLKLNDITYRYSIFELTGPQADSFITLVFDSGIENCEIDCFSNFRLDDFDYWIAKRNDFNIKKYFIISKGDNGINLIKYMLENKSVFDFRIVGQQAYNIFRIEKGLPSVPNEINDFTNPHEVGLINEVSFTKGCYIGQEVISRLDTYNKVQRNLKGISVQDNSDQLNNAPIFNGHEEIGKITSSVFSATLKKNIGLALIKKDFSFNGYSLTTKDELGSAYNITVVDLPFKK